MDIFEKLSHLGAGDFKHINGELITHLKGTYQLLKQWGANEVLCLAGLFHAAYGTDGFAQELVENTRRAQIIDLIGIDVEAIVYTYCACDRDSFWSQIGKLTTPIFEDRFTGEKRILANDELTAFCELTVANEIEIAKHNNDFIENIMLSFLIYSLEWLTSLAHMQQRMH